MCHALSLSRGTLRPPTIILGLLLGLATLVAGCDSGGGPGTSGDNEPPSVSLSATPTQDVAPFQTTVTVDGSDSDGRVQEYKLDANDDGDFDDEHDTVSGEPIEVSFEVTDDRTLRAVAIDDDGAQTTDTRQLTTEEPQNQAPTITAFTASPEEGRSPLETTVTAEGEDADGPAPTAKVDTNQDGTYEITGGTPLEQTVTFDDPGQHVLEAIVEDDDGAQSEALRDTVDVSPPQHELTFQLYNMTTDETADPPATYTVNGTSKTGSGTVPFTVEEGNVILQRPTSDNHFDRGTAFVVEGNTVAYTDAQKVQDTLDIASDTQFTVYKINEKIIANTTFPDGENATIDDFIRNLDDTLPEGIDKFRRGSHVPVCVDKEESTRTAADSTENYIEDWATVTDPQDEAYERTLHYFTNGNLSSEFMKREDCESALDQPYLEVVYRDDMGSTLGVHGEIMNGNNVIDYSFVELNLSHERFDNGITMEELTQATGLRSDIGLVSVNEFLQGGVDHSANPKYSDYVEKAGDINAILPPGAEIQER